MRRGKFVRWGVPIAAVVVVGAAIGTGPVIAAVSGDPALPERTAAELLADASAAVHNGGGPKPMSGTVLETASLGLPALPSTGGGADASPLTMLSGSHEVKVWYGARDKIRLALPSQMSETNLIVNGEQAWYWNSDENTATRVKFAPGADKQDQLPTPSASDLTPQQAAEKALAMVGEYTAVSVTNTDEVAGRPVYQIVLAPKDPGSLVQDVRIAVDGENYVPLRVQVFAKGSAEAAFEVKFTEVTFTPPAEENFAFTPPAGAKVVDKTIGAKDGADREERAKELTDAAKVVGEGWTSVAVLPMPKAEAKDGVDPIAEFLKTATPVEGGKVIRTKLLTALVTDDGRLLVGAVTPEVLQKAAQAK
ncbi:outer membrane lipoprotein carrier protein LolA [Nonomuraea sp. NPDC050556]|uniref:outer membrane lipoprotein carrier protein LolA n=1 Tax=Nonomuraea sp. NPDC050556 TaxID=3364369 RepID=UPI0037A02EF4